MQISIELKYILLPQSDTIYHMDKMEHHFQVLTTTLAGHHLFGQQNIIMATLTSHVLLQVSI